MLYLCLHPSIRNSYFNPAIYNLQTVYTLNKSTKIYKDIFYINSTYYIVIHYLFIYQPPIMDASQEESKLLTTTSTMSLYLLTSTL